MKSRVTLRLLGFEAAVLLVVIVIGVAGYIAFNAAFHTGEQTLEGVEEKRVAFKATQEECLRIADHIQSAVSELNQALFRFVTQNDSSAWDQFKRQSHETKQWIEAQRNDARKMKLIITLQQFSFSMSTSELLDEIDRVYGLYLTGAEPIGLTSNDKKLRLQQYENAMKTSRQLLALSGQVRGRGEVIGLLQAGHPTFPWRKLVLFALLVLLVLLGGWFTVIVYRREVMPMRVELMESKTIIERQQKLAHFGELAAGLAHEIRNPLTAINARLFTLQKGLTKGTAEHEDAAVIRTEISRLDYILKEFLALARPSDPKPVSVEAMMALNEVRELLAPECERRSIELKCESEESTHFMADPMQIKQVLINLVQNAAESLDHGGRITLRSRKDTCPIKGRESEAVIIEVEDTGPGISKEVQERLFDPFYSTKAGGTGLGLPISARIIEKHGGELNFQTQIGQGTTFSIILPASKA